MNKREFILKNGIILTPFKKIKNHNLHIFNGKILKYFKNDEDIKDFSNYEAIDLKNEYFISPGFIDIHTHGGGGEDCVDGNMEIISEDKLKQGITGFLPTIIASPLEMIYKSFGNINNFMRNKKSKSLPKILGTHIEGIYLNEKYRGAQGKEFLRKPNLKECNEIIEKSHGLLKIMTLAPELDKCIDIIKLLSKKDIISSIGHSDASIEQVEQSVIKGAAHVTHDFNAIGEMSFKEPGVRHPELEGIILVRNELKLEVIGELTHVDPNIIEIIFRCKGSDNIILITDSLSVSGLCPGKYKIGVMNLNLEKENPYIARLDDGGLAGSTIPLIKAVKNFYENTSATLNQYIQIATCNPLKSLSLSDKKAA